MPYENYSFSEVMRRGYGVLNVKFFDITVISNLEFLSKVKMAPNAVKKKSVHRNV